MTFQGTLDGFTFFPMAGTARVERVRRPVRAREDRLPRMAIPQEDVPSPRFESRARDLRVRTLAADLLCRA